MYISSHVFSALDGQWSTSELGDDFSPFLDALHSLVLTIGYTVLATVAVMVVIHTAGALLFYYLRTRHVYPVRRSYVTTVPIVATYSAPSGGSRNHGDSQNATDSEADDDNELRHLASNASPGKLQSMLTTFKYSETKV